jgi:hypothetical protein
MRPLLFLAAAATASGGMIGAATAQDANADKPNILLIVTDDTGYGGIGAYLGGKPRRTGRLALGRVNSHHERMKTFVNRLARGASTVNLMTYLGWQRTVGRAGFGSETLLREALGLE